MRIGRFLALTTLIAPLTLATVACTDDEPKMEEAVQPEAAAKPDEVNNKFTVDDEGRVHFEAEIVYFGYDDYTLTEQAQSRLAALAEHMKKNPELRNKIQGHCDERGSPEYNLALGARRAESVRTYLSTVGIDAKRLDSISFGEEKPAAEGHSEDVWAKNRRADFVFVSH
jgi:peptidoglycan-associated lipoprotein